MTFEFHFGVSSEKDDVLEFAGLGLTKEFYHLIEDKMIKVSIEKEKVSLKEVNDLEKLEAWLTMSPLISNFDDCEYFQEQVFVPALLEWDGELENFDEGNYPYKEVETGFEINGEMEYSVTDLKSFISIIEKYIKRIEPSVPSNASNHTLKELANFHSYLEFFKLAEQHKFIVTLRWY